jgi:hypothetical protein
MQDALGIAKYRIRLLPAPPGAHFAEQAAVGVDTNWQQHTLVHDARHCYDKAVIKDTAGSADILGIGSFSSYVECERKLRQKWLVHPDGALQLQLELRIVN